MHPQIWEQLPLDLLAALGPISSLGINRTEDELQVSLLLAPRRTTYNGAEVDLQHSGSGLAALVAHLNRMRATDLSSVHLGGDRGIAISSQPVLRRCV